MSNQKQSPVVDIPTCNWCGTEFIVYPNELSDPQCQCERKRKKFLWPFLGDITPRMNDAVWGRVPEPVQRGIDAALKCLSNDKEIPGLWIRSGVGTGKTMALGLAGRKIALEHDVVVRYVNVVRLFRRMTENLNESDAILSPYLNCELLLLDDLGKEYATSWKNEVLYYLIDTRYQAKSPMWVATNMGGAELEKRCGPAIIDRLSEVCEPIVFDAPSMRVAASEPK